MLTIGGEIEFGSWQGYHVLPPNVIERLELQREFYDWQIEFNNFLMPTEPIEESISNALEEFRKTIIECGVELKSYLRTLNLQGYYKLSYYSIVFNGLHLHFSLPRLSQNITFNLLNELRIALTYAKLKNNPTLRSLTSHHIWGYYRVSEYNFKQKEKYKPLVFTRHRTLEIRIVDFTDLQSEWLPKFLEATYKVINNPALSIYTQLGIPKGEAEELFRNLLYIHQDFLASVSKLKQVLELMNKLNLPENGDNILFDGFAGRVITRLHNLSKNGRIYRRELARDFVIGGM